MPTFSQNPHIDYWPVGASLQPNSDFTYGSIANWSAVTATNGSNVLSSNTAERAPGVTNVGAANIVSTVTTTAASTHQLSGGSASNSWPTFVSTDRVFVEAWVKILGTTGTIGTLSVTAHAKLVTSAGSFLADFTMATLPSITVASGWTRLWGTATGATFIGAQATANRALSCVQLNTTGCSAGATITWAVGEVNYYETTAFSTSVNMVAGGSLINQGMPYTAGPNAQTADMVTALTMGPNGGPVAIS
jgi:hypothetical protein